MDERGCRHNIVCFAFALLIGWFLSLSLSLALPLASKAKGARLLTGKRRGRSRGGGIAALIWLCKRGGALPSLPLTALSAPLPPQCPCVFSETPPDLRFKAPSPNHLQRNPRARSGIAGHGPGRSPRRSLQGHAAAADPPPRRFLINSSVGIGRSLYLFLFFSLSLFLSFALGRSSLNTEYFQLRAVV